MHRKGKGEGSRDNQWLHCSAIQANALRHNADLLTVRPSHAFTYAPRAESLLHVDCWATLTSAELIVFVFGLMIASLNTESFPRLV